MNKRLLAGSMIMMSVQSMCSRQHEELFSLVEIGATYEHYSGKKYIVRDVVYGSEDCELQVVYQGLYDDQQFGAQPKWVRPLKMFVEEVEIKGVKQPRFRKIS